MRRAACSIGALLLLVAPIASAGKPGRILVLPFRAVGVDAATVTAVWTVLAGELEARGFEVGDEAAGTRDGAEACDEMDCALVAAQRAGADRVVFGTLCKLGGSTVVRVHALRVGSATPYYRDQVTAAADSELPDLLARIAGAIGAGRRFAGTVAAPRPSLDTPRLGFSGGLLFPISDSYGGRARLASVRLYLHRERGDTFLEMGIPFAGLAWSGDLDGSEYRARAIDWTLYDFFVGKQIAPGDHPAHFGVGMGLHRLDFRSGARAYPVWKTALGGCGSCGNADGIVLTGETGIGTRLARLDNTDLILTARFRLTLIPTAIDDDATAQGALFHLGVIF